MGFQQLCHFQTAILILQQAALSIQNDPPSVNLPLPMKELAGQLHSSQQLATSYAGLICRYGVRIIQCLLFHLEVTDSNMIHQSANVFNL